MVMKKISGFTLVELLITLVVVAITVGIGAPSLRQFIQNSKINVSTNDLVSALQVARSQAIREGMFGCVCPSSSASDAVPSCLGTNNWEEGWIAFLDTTGDCVFGPPADVLLKVKDTSDNDGTKFAIRTNAGGSITAVNYVRFNSRGAPEQAAGSSQRGVWSICDDRGVDVLNNFARAVELSSAGSVRSSKDAGLITACPL